MKQSLWVRTYKFYYFDIFLVHLLKLYQAATFEVTESNVLEIFEYITFIYEKLRSGDITQGLPKVEQILEIRSIDSISMNLEKRIDAWNECITRILGIPWGFLIDVELTIAQSRISLVNKIQKVYRSQGVHIHNRHIEIIVRQKELERFDQYPNCILLYIYLNK